MHPGGHKNGACLDMRVRIGGWDLITILSPRVQVYAMRGDEIFKVFERELEGSRSGALSVVGVYQEGMKGLVFFTEDMKFYELSYDCVKE